VAGIRFTITEKGSTDAEEKTNKKVKDKEEIGE
jgi:hypothetical protein